MGYVGYGAELEEKRRDAAKKIRLARMVVIGGALMTVALLIWISLDPPKDLETHIAFSSALLPTIFAFAFFGPSHFIARRQLAAADEDLAKFRAQKAADGAVVTERR